MARFPDRTDAEIARLAVPAFGALVAQPLYVLTDTAVVGHLGTPHLGGLALAGQTLLTVHALMIFLAYGTTATVARLLGAGDEAGAAREAVQSMWLALVLGIGAAAGLWAGADPVLELLGGEGEVLAHARTYLIIAAAGLPATLVSLAAVGYLRGMQDTLRPLVIAVTTAALNVAIELVLILGLGYGIGAAAAATVVAQTVGALVYIARVRAAVLGHGVSIAPRAAAIVGQAGVAGDLVLRTAALRGSFTVGVAAAARIGDVPLAAHEIAFQLWMFVALGLDAVAIAGQALMGRFLGAGDTAAARRIGNRMVVWGAATGTAALVLLVAARPWLPGLFSRDPEVVALAGFLCWHLALMQPVNGVVFALDGVLIGAGDMRYLAVAMTGAAAAFVPLALAVPALDLGIGWLWAALWVLMIGRLLALAVRFRGDAWLVTGARRGPAGDATGARRARAGSRPRRGARGRGTRVRPST